jgi:hypothetical protein
MFSSDDIKEFSFDSKNETASQIPERVVRKKKVKKKGRKNKSLTKLKTKVTNERAFYWGTICLLLAALAFQSHRNILMKQENLSLMTDKEAVESELRRAEAGAAAKLKYADNKIQEQASEITKLESSLMDLQNKFSSLEFQIKKELKYANGGLSTARANQINRTVDNFKRNLNGVPINTSFTVQGLPSAVNQHQVTVKKFLNSRRPAAVASGIDTSQYPGGPSYKPEVLDLDE